VIEIVGWGGYDGGSDIYVFDIVIAVVVVVWKKLFYKKYI
jgi:hypothetical protein